MCQLTAVWEGFDWWQYLQDIAQQDMAIKRWESSVPLSYLSVSIASVQRFMLYCMAPNCAVVPLHPSPMSLFSSTTNVAHCCMHHSLISAQCSTIQHAQHNHKHDHILCIQHVNWLLNAAQLNNLINNILDCPTSTANRPTFRLWSTCLNLLPVLKPTLVAIMTKVVLMLLHGFANLSIFSFKGKCYAHWC